MALKIDKAQLQIEILQDTAMQNLKNLETQIRTAKTEMNKLKEGTDEYNQALAKVKQLNNTYQELASKINISEMPMSMLIKRQRELNAALREMRPNSANYQNFRNELDATNKRILELKGKAVDTGFSLTKVADGMNKYAVLASGVAASFAGITLTAKKCVDAYADMQEAEAQVIKYTGLTQQQVDGLNEDFKKMDTRTSREQLNALAGQAGQLGITSKKGIEDFVDAADKINVALGQELGQDAVKTIGRLAMMFGEDKTKGLRGAMLATGSAVNQLAQSVGSDADYLVDFLSRVAGVSKLANISQANIIGYASVLNLNRQQVEMAATAFQTLLLKMYQDPAKFAKLAGQDVKQFTKLLKTDANEAVLQFMTTLKGQGGFDKIAPLFKDMGLDGVRASGVLSTLAGKIADVRKQQQISNQAYKDGTSATQEFNVQNNTVKAGFEKAKKDLLDQSIILGEKLKPAMTGIISSTRLSIKVLGTVTSFIIEHRRSLTLIIATLATYYSAVKAINAIDKLHAFYVENIKNVELSKIAIDKLSIMWTNTKMAATKLYTAVVALLEGNLKKAKEEMIAFNAITKLNPFAILLAALVAVCGVMYLYATRTTAATAAQQEFIDLQNQAVASVSEEITKTQLLFNVAKDETKSKRERRQAIQDLNKISPEYLGNLNLETIHTRQAKAAVDAYVHSLIRQAEIQAETKRLADINGKIAANGGVMGWLNKNRSGFWGTVQGTLSLLKHGDNNFELKEMLEEKKRLEADLNKRSGELLKQVEQDKSGGGGKPIITPKPGKTHKTNPETPYNIDTHNLEAAHTKELNSIKKNALDNNKTEAEYNLDNIKENRSFYEKKYTLIEKYLKKTKDKKMKSDLAKDEQDTLSQLIDIDKQMGDARLKVTEEQRDRKLNIIEETALESKQKLAKQYADGVISEGEYNVKVDAIDENLKSGKLAALKDYQDKVNQLEIKDGQAKLKAVNEANKAALDADIDANTAQAKTKQTMLETVNNFRKNSGIKTTTNDDNEERLKALKKSYEETHAYMVEHHMDTAQLDAIYNEAEKESETEHQKALLDIKEQYGINTTQQRYDLELQALDEKHNKEKLSDEDYYQAKQKLDNDYLAKKLDKWEQNLQAIESIVNNVSSAVQGFAEAETVTSDAKYDKQIKTAKKAGKDTTKLEEQKEAAQNKIKRKYADIQFAASVLQIGSSTAVAAMEAYKALAGIPVVGPALAHAAEIAAILSGAAQIKVAKANRDAAKGLYTGGFSNDYVQGYTGTGNSHDVAGAIPVHKNEWVANHEAVANPHVRKFLDVFNIAQRNGTINMLDTTAILQQLQLTGGKYSGGYTDTPSGTVTTQHISVNADNSALITELQQQNKYLKAIADKKLTLAMTDVRDKLNELKTYESNASR
jgi:TP901 family phage tail tape measure protein